MIRHYPNNYTLNCNGRLLELDTPKVMGILNVTPDSFYAGSRRQTEADIVQRTVEIGEQGGHIIDIGAYSTRPGADEVTPEEELRRLRFALEIVRREAPEAIVSVDTFRADVACACVEEFGVDIVNDISGGDLDADMFPTVARLGVPYILMHIQGEPRTMQQAPAYGNVEREVFQYLAERLSRLRSLGAKDIILDPGFGFGKTLVHNYTLMAALEDFHQFSVPLLVGISRKSMIYKLLGGTPADALNGTTALNMTALLKGAHILRVHDVKAAVEAVRIYGALAQAPDGR